MVHVFDVDIAKEYGMLEAVLIQNFDYWISYNRANKKNFFEGRYWTYNSMPALAELFPYANERQIRYALKSLRDKGILMTGSFNKEKYDRTLWYAFTDFGNSMLQNCRIDVTKLSDGCDKIVRPIPYINTYINTDINSIYSQNDEKRANGSSESDEHGTDTKKVAEAYNRICTSMPKCTKLSDKRRKHIKARLKEFTMDEIELVFSKAEASDFLSGRSGTWKANFDWFTRSEDNMRKVLEGNYDNKRSGWEFGDI